MAAGRERRATANVKLNSEHTLEVVLRDNGGVANGTVPARLS
jgi:hypothetical protein